MLFRPKIRDDDFEVLSNDKRFYIIEFGKTIARYDITKHLLLSQIALHEDHQGGSESISAAVIRAVRRLEPVRLGQAIAITRALVAIARERDPRFESSYDHEREIVGAFFTMPGILSLIRDTRYLSSGNLLAAQTKLDVATINATLSGRRVTLPTALRIVRELNRTRISERMSFIDPREVILTSPRMGLRAAVKGCIAEQAEYEFWPPSVLANADLEIEPSYYRNAIEKPRSERASKSIRTSIKRNEDTFNGTQAIEALSKLSLASLNAIALATLGATEMNAIASTDPKTFATNLVNKTASGAGMEELLIRTHQTDPLQGLLQRTFSRVSKIDVAFSATRITSHDSDAEAVYTDRFRIPMLVAVNSPQYQLDHIPELEILSRLGRIVAGVGSWQSIRALEADSNVLSIESSQPIGETECAVSVPFIKAEKVHIDYKEEGDEAIVGVIDASFDPLHEAFRSSPTESRILAIWDQRTDVGPHPPGFTFGTYHSKSDVENYIKNKKTERGLYRVDDCHGTHVASIAAGSNINAVGYNGGVARKSKIVVVLVKTKSNPGDPISIGYSVSHNAALAFIKGVAEKERLPVVVNVSLGQQAGAHDGSSPLEITFDEFSENGRKPGFVIVKSAGNDRASKLHATVPVNSKSMNYLRWDSPYQSANPNSRHKDVIDIWFPSRNELKFTLISPSKEESNTVSWTADEAADSFKDGNTYVLRYVRLHADNGHSRLLVTIEKGTASSIAPKAWQLKIVSEDMYNTLDLDCWIDRTGPLLCNFANHVVEERTLSIPGTSRTVISVGAVKAGDYIEPASFSAFGKTRDGRQKPEVAAPGVGIVAAAGNTFDGVRSDNGTSQAAPHVTGAIALVLSRAKKQTPSVKLNVNQIREALSSSVLNYNGSWHVGTGYGVIDVKRLMDSLGL